MKIYCFDTQVLIWGIKEDCTTGQEDMIPRTKHFIESIGEDTVVLIPTIVLAEFLMRIPQDQHAMVINLCNKSFNIAPFDPLCASKYSTIWNTNKPTGDSKKILANGATRAELKADSLIVATAVTKKAECIYSRDNGIKNFAKGFIEVSDIPFNPQNFKMKLD